MNRTINGGLLVTAFVIIVVLILSFQWHSDHHTIDQWGKEGKYAIYSKDRVFNSGPFFPDLSKHTRYYIVRTNKGVYWFQFSSLGGHKVRPE